MKELKAKKGYYLTQVAEMDNNRIYITAIKGVNVNESDWREATQEEKNKFEKELSEKTKKESVIN